MCMLLYLYTYLYYQKQKRKKSGNLPQTLAICHKFGLLDVKLLSRGV
jgi:hypothetical protein